MGIFGRKISVTVPGQLPHLPQYVADEGVLKPATLGQIRKRVRQGRMNVRKKLF